MIQVVGTSKVNINTAAMAELLNSLVPEGKEIDFQFKLDARGNVKSTFIKMEATKATIYTGAVATEWDAQFISSDNVTSATEAMLFIAALGLKKALLGTPFDMKLSNMANIRVDNDFEELRTLINKISEKFQTMETTVQAPAPAATSTPAPTQKKTRSKQTAAQPLTEVPTADIPADLDLLSEMPIPAAEKVEIIPQEESNPEEAPGLNLDEAPLV